MSRSAAMSNARPPQVQEVLKKVGGLIEAREYDKALEVIAKAKGDSPWLTNALGVCHLRRGAASSAVDAFRGLVLASGGLLLRPDAPVTFKRNYAAALLLSGNLEGAEGVLRELGDEAGESGAKLRQALANWKLGLSVWQKLNWYLGGRPAKPVELGFPPGEWE